MAKSGFILKLAVAVGVVVLVFIALKPSFLGKITFPPTTLLKPTVIFSPTPTPRPIPTPYPLAQGKQVYRVSDSSKSGPKIVQVIVDPFDPKTGATQRFDVDINDAVAVTEVSLNLKTDHGSKTYPLKLVQGEDTEGKWSVAFPTTDTHDYTYQAGILASDANEKNKVELTFR